MSADPLPNSTTSTATDGWETQPIGWALQHEPWLRRLISRRVQPLDCDDEVLQEVWLAAARSPSVPSCPDQQTPWLARVALRQCALALRTWGRRRRRESVYADQQRGEVERAVDDPIFALLADEQRRLVREQLQHLPETHRTLLELKYVHGCTYREISHRLEMDLTAVEYQLAKARKALRRRLVLSGLEGGSADG